MRTWSGKALFSFYALGPNFDTDLKKFPPSISLCFLVIKLTTTPYVPQIVNLYQHLDKIRFIYRFTILGANVIYAKFHPQLGAFLIYRVLSLFLSCTIDWQNWNILIKNAYLIFFIYLPLYSLKFTTYGLLLVLTL